MELILRMVLRCRNWKINFRRIQQAAKHVKIIIQDNGKGIDAEVMENIFDPKFSVTSSQTGLGLPICKRIIEFYRGNLTFTTQKEVGTTFYIQFPLTPQN
ncbi:MAG: ATP-binding protein [Bacteroidota bacterium]